ncbi:endonuclease [Bacillus phage W.Ph.]|uniref:Gp86 n=1 Tax=Bacillus phage W.Ph. TaxID=764595 RepID=G9B1I7_9CAUD|nr:endonuclease [Bacillus phage W.Ph.]ADH03232.1 gp86 [Bacillus phage W.Ph.]
MKKCNFCKEEKRLEDFPFNGRAKRDGTRSRSSKCRVCTREMSRKYKQKHYENNKQDYYERNKTKRLENPEEVAAYQKQYYEDHKEELKVKQKAYSQTDAGLEARQRAYDKYRNTTEGKIKEKARSVVNHAVRDGKLIKPDCCDLCKTEGPVEGHHEDYNKPLEVIWVCKQCHEDIHHLNEGHESGE